MKQVKSKKIVLDSWALLAYFEGQASGPKVKELFKQASENDNYLLMSVINWGEVLYTIELRHSKAEKEGAQHLMDKMHIQIIDIDKPLVQEAIYFKVNKKLPYADCFAAALSKQQKAILVTGDKDFTCVEDELSIYWL